MEDLSIFSSEIYALLVLPIFIFIARVLDVTLGTIRIVFISKGLKYLAPMIGFFEIMIWLLAIGQIFQNLTSIVYYIAYAGGFATGTFVGIIIENKLSIGTEIVRIVTHKEASKLIDVLKSKGYGVTNVDAEGAHGQVNIIYTIVDRHDIQNVVYIIKKYNPNAFYTIGEVRFVSKRISPQRKSWYRGNYKNLLRFRRKAK
jgi:uncharacterized protein YebE (UPF0316 family)